MPIRLSGLNSGLDTDSIVKELVSAHSLKKDKLVKSQTKLSWKQDAWKEMNSKVYNFYSKSLSNMRTTKLSKLKNTKVSDTTKATVTAGGNVGNGTQTLQVNQLASAGYLTGSKISSGSLPGNTSLSSFGVTDDTLKVNIGGKEETIQIKSTMTLDDFAAALEEKGLEAKFDVSQQRFFIQSGDSGKNNDFNFVVDDTATLDNLMKLGLATEKDYEAVHGSEPAAGSNLAFGSKKDASNAIIELNGALFENDTNEFSINGLNITATGVSDLMTITTETDVDGIYDMVVDFFKEYNELMGYMEKAINADRAKGYEPLTDEEKSELSEEEVKKWEEKIKESLLRGDDTLSSVMSTMSMGMMKSYTIDGKSYSLASFGIKTSGYFASAENERYAYHIDGNAKDEASSDASDLLRKAIMEDPETVEKFFSQLTNDLYGEVDKKMKSTEMSSAYAVYNDKQMKEEYDQYTKDIKKMEEKLKDLEERYYKQFSAMEVALAKLQSQTDSLTSMLGG